MEQAFDIGQNKHSFPFGWSHKIKNHISRWISKDPYEQQSHKETSKSWIEDQRAHRDHKVLDESQSIRYTPRKGEALSLKV